MSDPRTAYLEAAVQGATPVQLVVLLYEQIIQDLHRAVSALDLGDIETRTREINHALTVIAHLQATLDREKGGEVARNLQHFYNVMRAELNEAQRSQSAAKLEEQIHCFTEVHDAWREVDRVTANPIPPASPRAADAAENAAPSPRSSSWSA